MDTTPETVLITGASSGIGWELARLFAADGARLVLVARNEDKLNELAAECRERHGVDAHVLLEDLSDPKASDRIHARMRTDRIHVDVLVNNAGFGGLGLFSELDVQRQVNMIQVNVAALTHLSRLFLPAMIERNTGGILNVGSTAGFQPGPHMAVYYATKAYVVSFTEALAQELSNTDIKISCLAPGPTKTGFGKDSGMGKTSFFKSGAMEAAKVGRIAHAGFRRGKVLVVPGALNKLSVFSGRLAPRALVRKIVARINTAGTDEG